MTSYRYPNEYFILAITLLLVFGVVAVTAVATLCGSVLFVLVMLAISILLNRSHHNELIQSAHLVTPRTEPALSNLIGDCAARLQSGPVRIYVAPGNILNAYTFGLVEPQVLVVYAGLFGVMDADELRFIIGHELGHVRLGHTWLNSIVGGMAGVPSPYLAAVVLYFAFRWWNRACEYSADRAGLLACGKPEKAASALIKLSGGTAALRSVQGWQQALHQIEAEDDHLENNLREMLSTHPMTIRRLDALRQYATSPEYHRLQAQINHVHPI
jgi:Zn-dependent protease with chaperone function